MIKARGHEPTSHGSRRAVEGISAAPWYKRRIFARLFIVPRFSRAVASSPGLTHATSSTCGDPVTAIRAADTDGNDATAADPSWEVVPEHPSDPRIPVDAQHRRRWRVRRARPLLRCRSDRLQHGQRAAVAGITRSFKSFSQAGLHSDRLSAGDIQRAIASPEFAIAVIASGHTRRRFCQ